MSDQISHGREVDYLGSSDWVRISNVSQSAWETSGPTAAGSGLTCWRSGCLTRVWDLWAVASMWSCLVSLLVSFLRRPSSSGKCLEPATMSWSCHQNLFGRTMTSTSSASPSFLSLSTWDSRTCSEEPQFGRPAPSPGWRGWKYQSWWRRPVSDHLRAHDAFGECRLRDLVACVGSCIVRREHQWKSGCLDWWVVLSLGGCQGSPSRQIWCQQPGWAPGLGVQRSGCGSASAFDSSLWLAILQRIDDGCPLFYEFPNPAVEARFVELRHLLNALWMS